MSYYSRSALMKRRVERTPNASALPQPVLDDFLAGMDHVNNVFSATRDTLQRLVPKSAEHIDAILVDEDEDGFLASAVYQVSAKRYVLTVPVTLVAVLNLFGVCAESVADAGANGNELQALRAFARLPSNLDYLTCQQALTFLKHEIGERRPRSLLLSILSREISQSERLSAIEHASTKMGSRLTSQCHASPLAAELFAFILIHELHHAYMAHFHMREMLNEIREPEFEEHAYKWCTEVDADVHAAIGMRRCPETEEQISHGSSLRDKVYTDHKLWLPLSVMSLIYLEETTARCEQARQGYGPGNPPQYPSQYPTALLRLLMLELRLVESGSSMDELITLKKEYATWCRLAARVLDWPELLAFGAISLNSAIVRNEESDYLFFWYEEYDQRQRILLQRTAKSSERK